MGSYATTTSLDTLMPDITFDTATTSLVSKCIEWAEGEVNTKLAQRYPIEDWTAASATPGAVISFSEQLAIGHYWVQTSRGAKESIARGNTHIKTVRETLNRIADHKMDLIDTDGSIVASRSGVKGVLSSTDGYMSTFAEDNPLNWQVDSTKITDIDGERS